jgi:hypothetical protein
MIRVMMDTDVLADLDGTFPLVATYSDLVPDEKMYQSLVARFPHSTVILIDRGLGDPTNRATVIDVESGAYSPASIPAWFASKRGMSNLTVYCDRDSLPAVVAAQPHGIYHWVATLDGTSYLPEWTSMHGPAAIQILGAASLGIHADLSLVFEDGWHKAS